SYSVSGSGTAEINYSNGRHQLKLTHTKDGVTYLTDTGEETYKYGTGDFRILTDGAVADGYHNGQLVFSYYMPQTKAVEKKITENGMTVSDFAVSIPEERGNFLVAENVTGKSVYRLGDTSSIHAVDFVADAKDEAHIVLNDSFYRTDLTLKNGKFYGWTSKEISSEPFVEELVDAYAAEGEVYYRLETVAGMSRLFANGRWIATFRNIQSVGDHTLAVDVTEGDGLSYLAVSGLRDIYYYEDDYFGKGQFESEDYWRSHKDMSIEHDVELGRMNLTARGKTDAMAEISANLGNFDISADVRVRKDTKGFWIYYNRPTTNDYSKAGYNYQTGQFEIVDQMAGYKTVVSAPGELPWEENVHLELKVREDLNNKYVTLYVNGEPVVSQTDSPWIRGRVGFMLTDGAAYVQNFHLRGDSKPMLGVNHSVAAPGAVSFSDMAVTDEGYKFFIASTGYGFTNDLGLTWQTLWTKGGGAGISDQVTNLPNGEILTIKNMLVGNKDGKNLYNAQVSVSKDGGHNWETVGMLEDEPVPMLAASGGRLKVGRSGRVYYTPALDATENPWNHAGLYYSDDNGRTWEQGGTIRAVDIDATIVEHCVVEAEGDELHCYTRTDQGTIIKIISYDRGKTWDTDHVYKTPFLSPECCMNIQADPVKEGVFWMSWSYDNDNVHGKGQYPRTNQSLAVSTDYGKTWNFYGRPYENNSTGVPSATTNLNLDLSDDYIVINSPAENSVKKAGDKPLIIFIPKDKQVVSKRWEQVHLEYPSQVNVTKPLSYSDTDKVLAIHPESNAVLLRGMRIVDVVYDGKVSAEVLASYLGGTVEAGENGALVFKYAGTETVVSADAIAVKDGKKYVEPKAFAEAAGLYVENEKNTVIISSFKTLGVSQKEALRYGLDFFTDEV
ncbi:MAG: exo-alpha-sialidase, partial [Clostridia bacterium]|nr:exo-alpha-sialidase [Clostridia bacterium]